MPIVNDQLCMCMYYKLKSFQLYIRWRQEYGDGDKKEEKGHTPYNTLRQRSRLRLTNDDLGLVQFDFVSYGFFIQYNFGLKQIPKVWFTEEASFVGRIGFHAKKSIRNKNFHQELYSISIN